MDREMLQKVQPVLLEIAKEIRRVCEENNIRYFLYRGTFLGAVRHQGFIPWDDDLDVAMIREDYEKFRKLAPEKLGSGFCFQDWHTDHDYPLPFGKVRKRNTVYLETKSKELKENGFYVDVYPLDYAPERPEQQRKMIRELVTLERIRLMKAGFTPWKENNRTLIVKRLGYLPYQAAALFMTCEKLTEKYEKCSRREASGLLFENSGISDVHYFRKEWCMELTQYPFAGEQFPGPKEYDRCLSSIYGDYMKLPPVDQRENRHQIRRIDFGE